MGCNKSPEKSTQLISDYARTHYFNQAVGSCRFGSMCGVMLGLNVLDTYAEEAPLLCHQHAYQRRGADSEKACGEG